MIAKYRIKSYQEFQEVIKKGEVVKNKIFTSYALKNDLNYTRIGISVPKKSGNAVIRNKIKRQIRACVAKLTTYNKSLDLVLIIRRDYSVSDFEFTLTQLTDIFKKVGIISE